MVSLWVGVVSKYESDSLPADDNRLGCLRHTVTKMKTKIRKATLLRGSTANIIFNMRNTGTNILDDRIGVSILASPCLRMIHHIPWSFLTQHIGTRTQ